MNLAKLNKNAVKTIATSGSVSIKTTGLTVKSGVKAGIAVYNAAY